MQDSKLASVVTGCFSLSAFASLMGIPVVITSSATRIKIWTINAVIKKYKPITKERKKKG